MTSTDPVNSEFTYPYETPRTFVRGVVLGTRILQISNEPLDPDEEIPD